MPNQPGDTPYGVECFNCKARFDAGNASWCSCLYKERTIACPNCKKCFCKAPHSYKQTFWASAPASLWAQKMKENRSSIQRQANPPPGEVTRPLVLVVDDEKEIQEVVARVIEARGYGLVTAWNGQEGLELARLYKPDLVLSDVLMPKLDGRELCLQIKSDPEISATKVVVMTSLYTSSKNRYEALSHFKADDYVSKPLEFSDLQAILTKHLG